ncbi:protein CTLA-2-alpha-like [Condylostylus longicornis]|uniref:protein CTLA-2-alpha-like n=1 Tax=Condylostylus longicornis TaxID=2530218 RepID=UPI00244E3A11|nr:protein CTLA-2-alpha-like [Condylostylus longicornis]
MFKSRHCNFLFVFCLITLFVVVVRSESTDVTDEEWENFKIKFEKKYNSEEDARRRKIYEATKIDVIKHNKRYDAGEVSYTQGINQFADLKPEEVHFGGIKS